MNLEHTFSYLFTYFFIAC